MVRPVTKKLAGRWGEAILLVSIFLVLKVDSLE